MSKVSGRRPIYSLEALLFQYLRVSRFVRVLDKAALPDDVSDSADAWILARELEQWMFSTPEGRSWVMKRLKP